MNMGYKTGLHFFQFTYFATFLLVLATILRAYIRFAIGLVYTQTADRFQPCAKSHRNGLCSKGTARGAELICSVIYLSVVVDGQLLLKCDHSSAHVFIDGIFVLLCLMIADQPRSDLGRCCKCAALCDYEMNTLLTFTRNPHFVSFILH